MSWRTFVSPPPDTNTCSVLTDVFNFALISEECGDSQASFCRQKEIEKEGAKKRACEAGKGQEVRQKTNEREESEVWRKRDETRKETERGWGGNREDRKHKTKGLYLEKDKKGKEQIE